MKVAIVGAGLMGQRLRDTFADMGVECDLLGHDAIEAMKPDSCKRALDGYDVAVNTAAFHVLGKCEADPMLARLVNTDGARNVAAVVPTVYLSTDYVFNDGGPHDESLPGAEPRSVYGRTKLAGELATLEHGGIVVRVSGVYDAEYRSHKGPSFPEMVSSGFDTLRLPTDQRFSPTYAPDAAERIASVALALARYNRHPAETAAGEMCAGFSSGCPCDGDVGGIYHAANAGSTSWAEWAEQINEAVPWRRHILPYEAHDRLRPKNSALRSTRLPPLRHFRLALEEWAEVVRKQRYVSPKRSDA